MTDFRKMKNVFLIKRIVKTSKHRFWLFLLLLIAVAIVYARATLGFVWQQFGSNPLRLSAETLSSYATGWFTFIIYTISVIYLAFNCVWALTNVFFPNTHSTFGALGDYEGEILNNLYQLQRNFVEAGFAGGFKYNISSGLSKLVETIKPKEAEVIDEDVEETTTPALKAWRIYIAGDYILYSGFYRVKLAKIEDIVCAYRQRTTSSSFLIRWASRKCDLILGFADASSWNINFKRNTHEAEQAIAHLKNLMPWVLTVKDNKKIKKAWEEDKDTLIYTVLDRAEKFANDEPMDAKPEGDADESQ